MLKWQRRLKIFFEDKVLSEWKYKIIALLAAFIMWAYVAGQQSMQAVYTVPIYFQNLPVETELINQKIKKVEVTVSGRRDRILSLRERQIWVSLDLTSMRIGKNVYKIKNEDLIVPQGIEIKDITPRKIIIRLNKKVKQEESKE